MPELTALLSGSYITYFHAKQILELLKVSDASTRTLFGGYSSQRIKDWQEIVRQYEADNLYLAECANYIQLRCAASIDCWYMVVTYMLTVCNMKSPP